MARQIVCFVVRERAYYATPKDRGICRKYRCGYVVHVPIPDDAPEDYDPGAIADAKHRQERKHDVVVGAMG